MPAHHNGASWVAVSETYGSAVIYKVSILDAEIEHDLDCTNDSERLRSHRF